MERKKALLIVVLILLVHAGAFADFRSDVYTAYITNRMELWKSAIDRMDAMKNKTNQQTLELLNYQYGYIGYCIGFNKKDEAKEYFEKALKNIELLEKASYRTSVISAYKSAFFGYRISFNKLSAPVNGLKSIDMAKLAIEQDPENYLGYVQYGNAQFYMPAAFGGSKKEALEYFLKARRLLEKNKEEIKGDWNYLSLLVLIGQTYSYLDELSSSKSLYEYILSLEPGFTYVRDELYPALLKKIKKT